MSKRFTNGYALLIGVDESANKKLALPDVAKDVSALKEVLLHEERCAYAADHVKVITGEKATRAGIVKGLDWLQANVEADESGNVTALVYYSGHGYRNKKTGTYYLLPYDVNRRRLATTALEVVTLAAEIADLVPQRLLVVLDCCHAAGMGVKAPDLIDDERFEAVPIAVAPLLAEKGGVAASAGRKGIEQLQVGAGRAVLSSCQGTEESHIRTDRTMSIFTYHLIEALTGHAQPEGGATEVLVSDVLGHVTRRVPRSAEEDYQKPQHPDFVVTGNFPVALLLGGTGLTKGVTPPDPLAPLPATTPSMQASVEGSGAIAQGHGAVAAGKRGVAIGGDAKDSAIVTGDSNQVDQSSRVFDQRGQRVGGSQTNIGGDVETGGGLFNTGRIDTDGGSLSGRDRVHYGLAAAELMQVIGPLMQAVMQASSPKQSAEAMATVLAIQAEAQKGDEASDTVLAGLTEKLVDLVPGAVTAVVSAFASRILAGVAGPVTHYVLEKLKEVE